MKKLFAPFALFAIAGMLLSSCSNSSKLAFTKRHYRSGNFVELASKPHTILAPHVTTSPKTAKPEIAPVVMAKPATYIAINAPVIASNKIQESSPINSISNSTKRELNKTIAIGDGPVMQKNQTVSENIGSRGDSDAAGAALSLLWIVIVIVLILWLIGILTGVGSLINLLLVVALILLILWLLRIL